MKLSTYKFKKYTFNKEWGDIAYWGLWMLWTRKDSEYRVGISTPHLNDAGRLYILPTISYLNTIPHAGDIRKTYKHWTVTLSFLKWRITLCDFQKCRIPEASESETV